MDKDFERIRPYDGMGSMVMSAVYKIWNEEPTAFTPGRQMWDYLYSKDAAEIFYALGTKGRDGSVYCVGSGPGAGTAKLYQRYIPCGKRISGRARPRKKTAN